MRVGICLDWLSATVPYSEKDRHVPYGDLFLPRAALPPQRPYTNSAQCGPLAINWNPDYPGFRALYRLPGEMMREMRANGWSDTRTLQWLHRIGSNITRIDVAVDVVGSDMSDPEQVRASLDAGYGRCTSRTRKAFDEWQGGIRKGYTLYIGASQSNRRVRVYDKGAKENYGDNWTRIEFVAGGDVARALAGEIINDGMAAGAREINRMCDPSLPWFDRAMMLATPGDVVSIGRKKTNSERWLHEVALPSVLEALRRGDPFVESQIWAELTKRGK